MEETFYWASRDFLKKILQESKNNGQLAIRDVSVERASGKGENYISKLYRVTVRTENPAGRRTFFVKLLPDEDIVRDLVVRSSAFVTETRMYRETLPRMNEALVRAFPRGPRRSLGPKCHHLGGAGGEHFVFVLEDLREKGYVMADRRQGLDLPHCLLVARTLARFHACSLAVREDSPASVEQYTTNMFFEESAEAFWRTCVDSTLATVAEVVRRWDGFGDRFADKLRALAGTLRDGLAALLGSDDAVKVLAHGDLWVNNVLFRYGVAGELEDAVLIDFQFCFYASVGFDLQNFVYSSPAEEVRAGHAEDLLREYHDELCATLRLLGLGHRAMTYRQLVDEYESKSLYGAFVALLCLPVIMSDPGDAFDFEKVLRDQPDRDAIIRRTTNEQYAAVLRRLLVEFERKGII